MRNLLKITFVLLFVLISNTLLSQTFTSFSDTAFVKELNRLYKPNEKVVLKKEVDSVLTMFTGLLESGSLSKSEFDQVLSTTNYFYKKKLSREKELLNYFEIVNLLKKGSSANFKSFHDFLLYMSKSNDYTITDMKKLLVQMFGLLKNNYLYSSTLYIWKVDKQDYKFVFDKDKGHFNIECKNVNVFCRISTSEKVVKLDSNNDTIKNKYGNATTELKREMKDFKMVNATTGVYNPVTYIWTGESGKVTWERVGLNAGSVYADLKKYTINMISKEFEADSVTFNNKDILNETLIGKYSDKLSEYLLKKEEYPQFESYGHNVELNNFLSHVDYKGGIMMKGEDVLGLGEKNSPATVKQYRGAKLFLLATSGVFELKSDQIFSEGAGITVYTTDKDSIYHPMVKTTIKANDFELLRKSEGAGKTDFVDSYHQVSVASDALKWKNDTSLYFDGNNTATISSMGYFSIDKYDQIQMLDEDNPLFEILNYMRYLASHKKVEQAMGNYAEMRALELRDENDPGREEDFVRIAKKMGHDEITKLGVTGFYASDFSRFLKKKPDPVRYRMIDLSYDGFVMYDPESQWVSVNPKLFHFTDSRTKLVDYDDISFVAENKEGTNAFINLNTMDLAVPHTKAIRISETRKTGFLPEGEVIIKKNRDMEFSGKVRTGYVLVTGEKFKFNYDNFDVQMVKAESASFAMPGGLADSSIRTVQSKIENLTGTLTIDKKGNRSGENEEITNYPILKTTQKSTVSYSEGNKQDTAYKKDKFFFNLNDFTLDSLANLNFDALVFSGEMNSDGIVPKFGEKLCIQPDGSLGFVHEATSETIPLFGGKGTLVGKKGEFKSALTLSNKGFGAQGQITWLTTITKANDFLLLPNSVSSDTASIIVNKNKDSSKGGDYPDVVGEEVKILWKADKDTMLYTIKRKPAKMYDKKASIIGSLVYTPKNMIGSGKINLFEGIINSPEIQFRENDFKSNNSSLIIKEDSTITGLRADKLRSYVDFKSGKSVFQKLNDESFVKLVNNGYDILLDHCLWEMGKNKLYFDTDISEFCDPAKITSSNIPLPKNYITQSCGFSNELFLEKESRSLYRSTLKDLEGLEFYGKKSDYNSKESVLTVKEVKEIDVADIVIEPASDIVIRRGGFMDSLINTTITDTSGVHTITNVNITIKGRNEYLASSGIYRYVDENKAIQNIYFSSIYFSKKDANKRSVGEGIIEKDSTFTLNPAFDFHGNVQFNANEPVLRFYGFARLKHSCASDPFWFQFDSRIYPDSVYIPLKPLLNSDDDYAKAKVLADILVAQDSVHVYTSFLSNMPYKGVSLLNLRDSNNYVFYDKQFTTYRISNLQKIKDRTLPGNYMDLETQNCKVYGEGKLNFSVENNQNIYGQFEIESVGNVYNDIASYKVSMETMTSFNFYFSESVLKLIAQTIDDVSKVQTMKGIDVSKAVYKENLTEYMGIEPANKLLQEYADNSGIIKSMPNEINRTLFFADLNFKWDKESESFKSEGDLGLGNIGKIPVNKYIGGKIQIHKPRTGQYTDRVDIYLEVSKDKWFYFTYKNGVLRGASNVPEFEKIVTSLKDKDRKPPVAKGDETKGKKPYIYFWCSDTVKDNFLKSFSTGIAIFDDDENLDKFSDEFEKQDDVPEDNPDENRDDNPDDK